MGYKGRKERAERADESGKTKLWTFETRERLDRFAVTLDNHGLGYEIQTKGSEPATGADGLVIVVAQADYDEARRLLLLHRKRRTSADRH
jgi:hypothetical protein